MEKGFCHLQRIYLAVLDMLNQTVQLIFGEDQPGEIDPFSGSFGGGWNQLSANLFNAAELSTFQSLDKRITQELVDSHPVELQCILQGRTFDAGILVIIYFRSLADKGLQVSQDIDSLQHFLDGIRT